MPSLPWAAGQLEQELCSKTEWDVVPLPLLTGAARRGEAGEAIPDPSVGEQAQGGAAPAPAPADTRESLRSSSQLRTLHETPQEGGHCAGCPPAYLSHHRNKSIPLPLHATLCVWVCSSSVPDLGLLRLRLRGLAAVMGTSWQVPGTPRRSQRLRLECKGGQRVCGSPRQMGLRWLSPSQGLHMTPSLSLPQFPPTQEAEQHLLLISVLQSSCSVA